MLAVGMTTSITPQTCHQNAQDRSGRQEARLSGV